MTPRDRAAGLTLVEMLVALVLFALVGLASFTTLDAIIRTRDRTEGRLETIARYDRALRLFTRDVMQSEPQAIALGDDGLVLSGTGGRVLSWRSADATLQRSVQGPGIGAGVVQDLLVGVAGLRFRVLDDSLTWSDTWPSAATDSGVRAVEMTIDLGEGQGSLLRLAETAQSIPAPQTFTLLPEEADAVPSPDAAAPVAEGN